MRLLLLFAVAGILHAQSWVPVTAGALQCGVLKRAIDQVQTYCYGPGLPLKLLTNAIFTIVPPCEFFTYQRGQDGLTWQFTLNGSEIDYQLAVNELVDGVVVAMPRPGGKLTAIFGQPVTVGLLDNGQCKTFGKGFHPNITSPPTWIDSDCVDKTKPLTACLTSPPAKMLANQPIGCRL